MSLTGKAAADKLLRGKVTTLKVVYTDAYELAVKNGFVGTLEEWFDTLKGEEVEIADDLYTKSTEAALSANMGAVLREKIDNDLLTLRNELMDALSRPVRTTSIQLPASSWVGSGNIYSQVVSIDGITENSQINLTPSVEQLVIFYEKDITFITENDDGVLTVYVIGQKPQNDYTIQASIVEVIV